MRNTAAGNRSLSLTSTSTWSLTLIAICAVPYVVNIWRGLSKASSAPPPGRLPNCSKENPSGLHIVCRRGPLLPQQWISHTMSELEAKEGVYSLDFRGRADSRFAASKSGRKSDLQGLPLQPVRAAGRPGPSQVRCEESSPPPSGRLRSRSPPLARSHRVSTADHALQQIPRATYHNPTGRVGKQVPLCTGSTE